jgi:hypothetical protein
MSEINLVLALPHGIITATSLGLEGFARHRSPGSGKFFRGKAVLVDLALDGDRPGFRFLEEGGWRDANGDTVAALAAVRSGNRTKTALSNIGFSVTPLVAYRRVFLVKTGGALLEMSPPVPLVEFINHACHEEMTTEQVARTIGRTAPSARAPRLLMVLQPVQFLIMTNLTPEEYAWYATHRPGKIFRQVMFAELGAAQEEIAAASRFSEAQEEMKAKPSKKTKVIAIGECLNDVPYHDWAGYRSETRGGLYVGDRNGIAHWPFPKAIPRSWDLLDG